MSEQTLISEEQSHYEVSLTAGQAFLAFVLLLLSLAASFAFGLMIGKGEADDRLTARKDAQPVITEAAAVPKAKAEIAAPEEDFKPAVVEEKATVPAPQTAPPQTALAAAPPKGAGEDTGAPRTAAAANVPHVAQLFSSADQKAAEAMAAKLIDGGFPNTYVERGANDKGAVFRVRVKFSSEAEARAAEPRLKQFSNEVWITKQ